MPQKKQRKPTHKWKEQPAEGYLYFAECERCQAQYSVTAEPVPSEQTETFTGEDICPGPYLASDLGNNNGYLCPDCKMGDTLNISAEQRGEARLISSGVDFDGHDIEWEDHDAAWCGCGWQGIVGDLLKVEVEDDYLEQLHRGEV